MTGAGEVGRAWLTWPPAVTAVLTWALGRLTKVAVFDLVAVAAGAWLGGYLLSVAACHYLIRTGQLPSGEDEPDAVV